jgi:radical SAM protein with 4Fe4S-binding SPASM domain
MSGIDGTAIEGSAQQRLDKIYLRADALQIPLHAIIELTYRCNIDCVHCYCQHLTNTHGRRELGTDEWKGVLDQLAQLGVLNLTLSGGEILVHRDFWKIAPHAKSLHFSLTLFTNGTMIDEKCADLLAELRPTSIEISILGATEESHDRLTRIRGTWKRMMRATELLRERNLPFVLKTTLMKNNIHEQYELEKIAKLYGCRAYKKGTELCPRNDGNCEPQKYRLGQQALFDYFIDERSGKAVLPEEQPNRALSLQKGTCGAGANGCAVNPYGDFLPCIQLMLPFGNVREKNLEEMWRDPPEQIARIRQTKAYGQIAACAECNLVDYCTRCHGLAELETGCWNSCYEDARKTAEVIRAVVKFKKEGILPIFDDERIGPCGPAEALVQIQGYPA